MDMQTVIAEFEALRIGLTEDDLIKTHDTMADFVAAQGQPLRATAYGAVFKRVAVVDAGDLRYAFMD